MAVEDVHQAIEDLFAKGNDYLTAQQRGRPYDGQPQTDQGERGKQEVSGVTMRDIADCIVIGMFDAGGFGLESKYRGTIHDLPWHEIDPLAVIQNAMCEVEKRMGIYPNVPRLEPTEGA